MAKKWRNSEIQSLLFPVDEYSPARAKRWAKDHGFGAAKVDTTDRYHRLRQRSPDDFSEMRTIDFGQGIKAVVGELKARRKRNGRDPDPDRWESNLHLRRGRLHRYFGVPEDEKIPPKLINEELKRLKEMRARRTPPRYTEAELSLFRALLLAKRFKAQARARQKNPGELTDVDVETLVARWFPKAKLDRGNDWSVDAYRLYRDVWLIDYEDGSWGIVERTDDDVNELYRPAWTRDHLDVALRNARGFHDARRSNPAFGTVADIEAENKIWAEKYGDGTQRLTNPDDCCGLRTTARGTVVDLEVENKAWTEKYGDGTRIPNPVSLMNVANLVPAVASLFAGTDGSDRVLNPSEVVVARYSALPRKGIFVADTELTALGQPRLAVKLTDHRARHLTGPFKGRNFAIKPSTRVPYLSVVHQTLPKPRRK